MVARDNDRVYLKAFDGVLETAGVDVKPISMRAPNLNAHVERFIQSIQVECMDHFLVFGEKHFDYIAREYVEHYHRERPHQGLGNLRIGERAPPEGEGRVPITAIVRKTRLGGLLSHYQRTAA